MNYEQFTGILRALLPAAMAYAVGKGWIPAGSVADISAAVVAVAAAVWSVVSNKTGKINGTGGVIAAPGFRGGGAIGSAIVIGIVLLAGGNARAADVAPAVVTKAPPVVATVGDCPSQLYCTGFFAGGSLYGIGGNAAILQNGINNSVFAGGGSIGLNGGWQYWNGQYFIQFALEGLVESDNTANVTGFAGNNGAAVGIVHIKLGGNLLGLLNNAPAPITVPNALTSVLMASYVDNCSAFRKGGTQYCGGAGQQFMLAPKLTMDVLYDYGAPTKNFNALQNVGLALDYHF
jgi:hypothetical protein